MSKVTLGLFNAPSFLIESVISYIELPDILHLWECGNTRLNLAMGSRGGVKRICIRNGPNNHAPSWPRYLSRFNRIEELTFHDYSLDVSVIDAFLPASLRKLDLNIDGDINLFLDTIMRSEGYPLLESLSLVSKEEINPQFFETLPPNLASLSLSCNLPISLESLIAQLSHRLEYLCLPETRDVSAYIFKQLPFSDRSATGDTIAENDSWPVSVPEDPIPIIEWIELPPSHFVHHQISSEHFFNRFKALCTIRFFDEDIIGDAPIEDDTTFELDCLSLSYLKLRETHLEPMKMSSLPRSVERLVLQDIRQSHFATDPHYFPPKLTQLTITILFTHVPKTFASCLPRTLLHLSIAYSSHHDYHDYDPSHRFLTPNELPQLPPKLQTLKMRGPRALPCESFAYLPKTLTTLKLPNVAAQVTSLSQLSPLLETLCLRDIKGLNAPLTMPPRLTSLKLTDDDFTIEQLRLLPKHLTEFKGAPAITRSFKIWKETGFLPAEEEVLDR